MCSCGVYSVDSTCKFPQPQWSSLTQISRLARQYCRLSLQKYDLYKYEVQLEPLFRNMIGTEMKYGWS